MSQRINYIKNPSFKSGSTVFWAPFGDGAVISSETDTALIGEYSLRVQKASGIFKCGARTDGYRIPVTAGSTYTTSAYVRMPEDLESRTYTCKIDWYDSAEEGSIVSSIENSTEIFNFQVSGLGFISVYATGIAPEGSTHAEISIYQEEREIDASVQPFRFFYIDSVMFEETAFIKGFFESITQDEETTNVNNSMRPVPYPEITGMELNADITLNGLIFNTIDEDGIMWVCTDLEGWWGNSEPEVANIAKGLGDGSYDVRGRYAAREIQFSGVFFPPSKDLVSKAREKLIAAIDLVKTNGWLIVDEEPPKASVVRLVDRPSIETVNSRGRTEFSFTLRAYDPIKYEWFYADPDGRDVKQVDMNSSLTLVNKGNSIVPAVFQMHGPMEVGTFIRNLANQQTLTLAQRLRGANETTQIIGAYREGGIATVRTNISPNIVVGDFVKVTDTDLFFNTPSSLVTAVIDDETTEDYQVSYLNEEPDLQRLFITSKSFSNNVATLTVSPDTIFSTNTAVVVSGIGSLFNGVHTLTSGSGDTITYNKPVSPTAIIKAFRVNNVATITTNNSLGVLVGDVISVSNQIGSNFNTSSETVLSVVDSPTTNTYSISYTNNFPNFGKSLVVQKSISFNVATLKVLPSYFPNPINANRIARLEVSGSVDTSFASNIGTGANSLVRTIAIQSDGKIILGGAFDTFNGTGKNGIVRLNPTGTIDADFLIQSTNINGVSFFGVTGANETVYAIAIQSDGKIILGGNFWRYGSVDSNYLARLNSNGTIDQIFRANIGTAASDDVRTVAIQSDGKIILGGFFTTFNGTTVNRIVRLNSDGTRDTTFTTNTGTGAGFSVNSVAIQSDGKIILGGNFTTFNGTTVNGIVRLNSDGTRDTTFTTNTGTGAGPSPGSFDVRTVAIQSDGKIILGGNFTTFNGTTVNRIVRLNSDGTRDTTFTTNTGTGANGQVNSVAIQPDGKIILGGSFTTFNGTTVNRIVRLNSDGTRDTAFTTNNGTGANNLVSTIVIEPDGQILLGGIFTSFDSNFSSGRLARLNPDGTLDTSFNNFGSGPSDAVNAMAIQPDGKILLGGDFTVLRNQAVGRIGRLNSSGATDFSFNTNAGTGANGSVSVVAIQPDGKIVIGGAFLAFNGTTVNRIVRLNSDGTRDTTFTTNTGTGADGSVSGVALQPDGKIVIVGFFTTFNGTTVNGIVRLNSDGTRDTTFTTNTGTGAGLGTLSTVAIQSDGKIILGGNFTTFNGTAANQIVRLNSDGTRDNAFTDNTGTGLSSNLNAIAFQPDGKILLGGDFTTGLSFFLSSTVVVSGVDSTFDGVHQLMAPQSSDLLDTIRYSKTAPNTGFTVVTSPTAFVEYSVPAGSVVELSGTTFVNSGSAFVEYSMGTDFGTNPLVGLADGDILEVNTSSLEVSLNGDVIGKRFYLETLADWVNLNKGNNPIQLSYLDNPITQKSVTNDIATIETFQEHNFRVGDSVKIQGVDELFDGIITITSIDDPKSFSFSLANEDIAPTAVSSSNSVVANADSHAVIYYRSGWLG